jgi:hypothetical protein
VSAGGRGRAAAAGPALVLTCSSAAPPPERLGLACGV